jgi:hypothetical protein
MIDEHQEKAEPQRETESMNGGRRKFKGRKIFRTWTSSIGLNMLSGACLGLRNDDPSLANIIKLSSIIKIKYIY